MIQYDKTTVFNVESQTIVNTVNCVGVMGTGLALECKLRFPEMYQDYRSRCKQKKVQIGKPYIYKKYDARWIANFPTKKHWKNLSQLTFIEEGLEYFVANYKQEGVTSIAFPKLGCNNGGLKWNDVQAVMERYLNNLDIDVYICLDEEKIATELESLMMEMLNDTEKQIWIQQLKIKQHIVDAICNYLPLQRFKELAKIKGVGKQTYQDLFQFLYSQAKQKNIEQIHKNMTPEEDKLWGQLRDKQLNSIEFEAKKIIAGFIVDFYCNAAKLVIEIDGEIHHKQTEQDAERDQILLAHGLRILRIKNEQINHNLDQVLKLILEHCLNQSTEAP